MGLKLVPTGLLVLLALASLLEAYPQNAASVYHQKPVRPPKRPPKTPAQPVHNDMTLQSKQMFPGTVLTWQFPKPPEEIEEAGFVVDLMTPVAPETLRIQCEEKGVLVEVDMDFFKTGQLINPADMTLGGCAAEEEDPKTKRLLFQSELHTCGGVLTTTSDELMYSFTILYTPTPLPGGIFRTTGAVVGARCHYPRNHNVSSGPLIPLWTPYSDVKSAEELLIFSLRLMMADWTYVRATTDFFLGDLIYIEASVKQFYHVPLRVYVDSCVASTTPDANSSPKYAFIENYGCFTDAKLTGSNSQFVKRSQDDKLRFVLEAFRFADTGTIFISCRIKASAATTPRDYQHKACSYIEGGWVAAGGSNDVCSCCDSSCGGTSGGQKQTSELWGDVAIGPIKVGNNTKVLG